VKKHGLYLLVATLVLVALSLSHNALAGINTKPPTTPPKPPCQPTTGCSSQPCNPGTENPVSFYAGAKKESATDLSVSAEKGMSFLFDRFYNSQETKRTLLGYGWDTKWSRRLIMSDKDNDLIVDALDPDPNTAYDWKNDPSGLRPGVTDNDGDFIPSTYDTNDNSVSIPKLPIYPRKRPNWVSDPDTQDFFLHATFKDQTRIDDRLGMTWDETAHAQYTIYQYYGEGDGKEWYAVSGDGYHVAPLGESTKMSVMGWNTTDCTIEIQKPSGEKDVYYGFHAIPKLTDGCLKETWDNSGNRMVLVYDNLGRIDRIEDWPAGSPSTLARKFNFAYWDDTSVQTSKKANLLKTVTWYFNSPSTTEWRGFSYDYDSNGNLWKVIDLGDNLTATADQRETRYTYSNNSSFPNDPKLWHNLTNIYRAEDIEANPTSPLPYKTITYGETDGSNYDMVITENIAGQTGSWSIVRYKEGDTLFRAYGSGFNQATKMVVYTNPAGEQTTYFLNQAGSTVKTEYKVDAVTTLIEEYLYDENKEAQLIQKTDVHGITGVNTYLCVQESPYIPIADTDAEGLGRYFQNKVWKSNMQGCGCGSGASVSDLMTEYKYDIFGSVRVTIEPSGNKTTNFYDYQEMTTDNAKTPLARILFGTSSPTTNQIDAVVTVINFLGIPMGLGDLNGDGVTTAPKGFVVRTDKPAVTLPTNSHQYAQTGQATQRRITISGYNSIGKLSWKIDPEGNKTSYAYDSRGRLVVTTRDDSYTTSFVSAQGKTVDGISIEYTVDPAKRNSRTSATPFYQSRTIRQYDTRGRLSTEYDARGVKTTYAYNGFDELITITRAVSIETSVVLSDPSMTVTFDAEPSADATQNVVGFQAYNYQTVMEYDKGGRVKTERVQDTTSLTGDGWVTTSKVYDRMGRVYSIIRETGDETDPTRQEVTYQYYDIIGRLVLTISPDGVGSFTEYNGAGNEIRQIIGITTLNQLSTAQKAKIINSANADTHFSTTLTGTPQNTYSERNRYDQVASVIDCSGGSPDAITGQILVTYRYDGHNRRVRETDAEGNYTTTVYDSYGKVTDEVRYGFATVAAKTANTTTTLSHTNYAYDSADRRIQVNQKLFIPDGISPNRTISLTNGTLTQAGGLGVNSKPSQGTWIASRVEYDRTNRITYLIDADSVFTENIYNGFGRVVETGRYNPVPEPDMLLGKTETWYDDNSNLIETKETDIATVPGTDNKTFRTTFFHDSLGRLVTKVVDAGSGTGYATDYRYNSLDQVRAISDAEGSSYSSRSFKHRDGSGSTLSTNNFGNVTISTYGATGRAIKKQQVMTASKANNGKIGYTLDGVVDTVTPLTPDYTQAGGTQVADGGYITEKYTYDVAGRLLSLTDDNGNKTTWTYDVHGEKLTETKGASVTPALADRVDTATTIQWSYNANGTLYRMTKEDGSVLTHTYDTATQRLTQISVSPALGVIGTTLQTFQYAQGGLRVESNDNNEQSPTTDDVKCTWVYDSLGRKIEESEKIGSAGTTRYVSYDYASLRSVKTTYPNGRTVYADQQPGGMLRSLADTAAALASGASPNPLAKYDYLGQKTLVRTMQNGINLDERTGTGTYYDALGQATQWNHLIGTTTAKLTFSQTFDHVGNKLTQNFTQDNKDNQTFTNDSAGRILQMLRPNAYSDTVLTKGEKWALDGVGNWSSLATYTGNAWGEVSRSDTSFNEYYQIGTTALTQDDNGNLTNDGTKKYKWDAFNRLRQVLSSSDVLIATYYYDADNRRVRKDVVTPSQGIADTDYWYSGWRVLEETALGATLAVRQFVYGNYLDEVLVMDVDINANGNCVDSGGSKRYFYHQNALYNVAGITDSSGNLLEVYQYDPYGKQILIKDGNDADILVNFGTNDIRTVLGISAIGNPYTFTGQRFDPESGLHYYKNRYYSSAQGRFISRDPIGYNDSGNLDLHRNIQDSPIETVSYADGPNLCQYTRSKPALYTDPDGLKVHLPGWSERCCKKAKKQGDDMGHGGGVICCDGELVTCAWLPKRPGRPKFVQKLLTECIQEHEKDHLHEHNQADCPKCGVSRAHPTDPSQDVLNQDECDAYKVSIECLRKNIKRCDELGNKNEREGCQRELNSRIQLEIEYANSKYKCDPKLN